MGRRRWTAAAVAAAALGLAASVGLAVGPGGATGTSHLTAGQAAAGQPADPGYRSGPVLLTAPAAQAAATPKWTTPMRLKRAGGCTLYPALRGTSTPLAGHEWHRSAGYRVGWRYRVNAAWTLVLDYGRADVAHRPRWAFVETSCLNGNKYPAGAKDAHGRVRNLRGRASHGWRHVRFGTTHLPGVHTTGTRTVVVAYTTIRDNPHAFAIGNLFTGQRFRITGRCTSHHTGPHHESPWIYGRDLQTGRWGWVPSSALHGNPCLPH